MSKLKKKHNSKMLPGDAVVVMPYSTLMYLAETCDILGSEQADESTAQDWRDIADDIRIQSNETHYVEQEEEVW